MNKKDLLSIIAEQFSVQIETMKNLILRSKGHFLLTYLDPSVLKAVILELEHCTGRSLAYTNGVIYESENTIHILDVDNLNTLKQQAFLYYCLERSKQNIVLILTSMSCMCIDSFEKRIRSRFNYRQIFLPYLNTQLIFDEVEIKNTRLNALPTLKNIENEIMRRKYKITEVGVEDILEMLSTLHLVILRLCMLKPISVLVVVTEFRKFVVGIKEMKNIQDDEILEGYLDLMNHHVVDSKNNVWYYEKDIHEFVNKSPSLFIKDIFRRY